MIPPLFAGVYGIEFIVLIGIEGRLGIASPPFWPPLMKLLIEGRV